MPNFAPRRVFEAECEKRSHQKAGSAEKYRTHPVDTGKMLHHPAQDHRNQDLGNHNEEIKDAHIDPDSVSGQNTRDHRIGHGNNAGGGDADPSEGKNQELGIPQPVHGKKRHTAKDQTHRMDGPGRHMAS